jgi:Neisseria PilC beta-propeller domain
MSTPTCHHRLIPVAASVVFALSLGAPAGAASSSGGEEYLSTAEAVPPNVFFLVDLSETMEKPCFSTSTDTADTSDSGTAPTDSGGSLPKDSGGFFPASPSTPVPSPTTPSTDPCIRTVASALDQVVQHYDWARYGLAGTNESSTDNDFYPIVPLGSSYAELSAGLAGMNAWSTSTRNLAESLASLSNTYFKTFTADDGIDDDLDGHDPDWDEAPIQYACQETHVIVIASGEGYDDSSVPVAYKSSISGDITCDKTGIASPDLECLYDNLSYNLYSTDQRLDLTDTQNVTVHTLGLGINTVSIAESLFGNASDVISGAGTYTTATTEAEILAGILTLMQDIRSGFYSRSTPVLSADGNYLIYSFFELTGDNPLAEGHVRSYEIDDDPASSTYGQVLYDGPTEFGGALWDAGDLLVSRPVTASESNPDDRDGFGKRDIYTYMEEASSLSSMSGESASDMRQGLDYEFATAVAGSSTVLDLMVDTSVDSSGCGTDTSYDLDKDGCLVDGDDVQALVDFVRGLPEAEYRYLDQERGTWKLGDSPHSVPVVVQGRTSAYAEDPSYKRFLDGLDADGSPEMVFIAANDGMLHAFYLEDDPATIDTEEGEEAWAWMPSFLLYREHSQAWAGRAIDMMLYGRTYLFDGAPVVEDAWVDSNGDGVRDCNSVPDDCEWRRVIVAQQGKGGPVTLALDITRTTEPKFLWEQTDETDTTAMGYTVGRPVIANVRYAADGSATHTFPSTGVERDVYMVMWGSGRAVPLTTSSSSYSTTEANLYMWPVGDDVWGTDNEVTVTERGSNGAAEAAAWGATLDSEADGAYEYGYIAAALAVVDVDSDGDADTVYFPVSTTYLPTDESGAGPTDIQDPGSTWMYKACINELDPANLKWAKFFDPVADGGLTTRGEVYYAATTAWHDDGALGVYWGTGTPYDRTDTVTPGYLFAVKDTAPEDCGSFTATPITDCGAQGVYALDPGEGLTGDPIVYAGVVYFTTWVPDADLCEGGEGRIYGLDFEDCAPGLDTDGDGDADANDAAYIGEEDSYLSSVTISDKGTVFYGTSSVLTDGSGAAVGTIDVVNDPYLGTMTMSWLETF